MSACLHVVHDDEFGAVAAAIKDGQIVATASSSVANGVYTALDEASIYAATGRLIPLSDWDACRCDCP